MLAGWLEADVAAGDGSNEPVVWCRNYTSARRHPMVIGKIAGWASPVPLTLAQAVVLVATFVGLLVTRGWWGLLVPGATRVLVLVGVPGMCTWAIRHARIEGRAPVWAAAGAARLAGQPAAGVATGSRRLGRTRRRRVSHRLLVAEDDSAQAPPQVVPAGGPRPTTTRGRWAALAAADQ